jgi:hypothetical protein
VKTDAFVQAQQDVIAECGLAAYLPTVWIESWFSFGIHVLTDDGDETLIRGWADTLAKRRNYYLGYRFDDIQFKVVVRENGIVSEQLVTVH